MEIGQLRLLPVWPCAGTVVQFIIQSQSIKQKLFMLKGPLGMRHFQFCQFWKFNLDEAI